MKSTKHFFLLFVIATLTLPLLNSCKKGDGDPFISLRSRKARVAGEWNIDSWKEEFSYSNFSSNNGSPSSSQGTAKNEISGNTVVMTASGSNSNPFMESAYTEAANGTAMAIITFKKDGTFRKIMEYKNVFSVYTSDNTSYQTTYNQSIETSGTWNFLGGIEKDYKNKERIILNITQIKINYNYTDANGDKASENEVQSYENGEMSEVWQLTTLKNKEMIMEAEMNYTGNYSYTDDWGGFVYVSSDQSSQKGTIKAVLKQ